MTPEEHNKAILARYLPPSAINPVYDFLNTHSVHFHITPQRSSKLGDYRWPQPQHTYHEISINGDLTPHCFLLVLLHEMAHLVTFLTHGRSVQPHGHEWQQHYANLIVEYAAGGHFPPEAQPLISRYTRRIPLNHAAGRQLEQLLSRLDNPQKALQETLLRDLPLGSTFRLKSRPKSTFRSIELRRTRYRCTDIATGRDYLISADATVLPPTDTAKGIADK